MKVSEDLHFSWQTPTQALNPSASVGHKSMQAVRDPPGQVDGV
jgi:hypothetical protein